MYLVAGKSALFADESKAKNLITWRAAVGVSSVEAFYVSQTKKDVTIRKPDGKLITCQKSDLAQENLDWLEPVYAMEQDLDSDHATRSSKQDMVEKGVPQSASLIALHNQYHLSPIPGLLAGVSIAAIDNNPGKAVSILNEVGRRIKDQRKHRSAAHSESLVSLHNNLAICEVKLGRPSPAAQNLVMALREASTTPPAVVVHNANLLIQASDKGAAKYRVSTPVLKELRLLRDSARGAGDLDRFASLLVFSARTSSPTRELSDEKPPADAIELLDQVADANELVPNVWCLPCRGTGLLDCLNPNCNGGKISFQENTVVGRYSSGSPIIANVVKKRDCEQCRGIGTSRCPDCDAGKRPLR